MTTARNEPTTQELELLSQTIRDVVCFHRLSADDAQDFAQTVQLLLLERQYDVFSRYCGRSSLRTYLTVVVKRMLLDWRNAKYGKWRPSVAAKRFGQHAVMLERLIYRDGYTIDEAVQVLAAAPGAPPTAILRALAAEVPPRRQRGSERNRFLSRAAHVDFHDPIDTREREALAQRTRQALGAAIAALPAEDRWVLAARYGANRRVPALAQVLQTEPRQLYGRFDRILRSLRHALRAEGIHPRGD